MIKRYSIEVCIVRVSLNVCIVMLLQSFLSRLQILICAFTICFCCLDLWSAR